MTRRVGSILCAAGVAAALTGCTPEGEEFARALVIEDLDQTIGGPKALARPGDILLENDHLRIAILGERVSMGPGLDGGAIIDADLQWYTPGTTGGHGRDQFGEMDPTVNLNVAGVAAEAQCDDEGEVGWVEIVSDGSDGGPATVRVTGPAVPFLTMLDALWALVDAPEFWLITDYVVEPGVPWLTIRSTAVVDWDGVTELPTSGELLEGSTDGMPILEWATESGLALGDFYLSGASTDVFGPGMGFDEDKDVYDSWQAGQNTFTDPYQFPFLAGVGDGVSYGLAAGSGDLFIPLFTAGQTAAFGAGMGLAEGEHFPPNAAYTYERYFFVGHGDVGSLVDQYVEARDIASGTVTGRVLEEGTLDPLSGVDVLVFEPGADRPWSQWRTDVDPRDDIPDGSFGGQLPVGEWELLAHRHGRPDLERVPVSVAEGDTIDLSLVIGRPGVVRFSVRDENNDAIPAKITVFRTDAEARRNSDYGDGRIAANPELVLFPLHGSTQVELAEGTYRAVATRGLEYEWGEVEFAVEANQELRVDLSVFRSIETDGWVAADLHVHADPSHDSGITYEDRIATMACEGVEFFAGTDHDWIGDYAPTVEQLGMERWVRTTVGLETTTLELGHFLGWPLVQDTLRDSGGAPDWTCDSPQEMLDDLRRAGRSGGYQPMVYVAHPRAGILGYFDQYGFDPYGGVPGVGGEPGTPALAPSPLSMTNPLLRSDYLTWDLDAVEIFTGKILRYVRTPTQEEIDRYADGWDVTAFDLLDRPLLEQHALIDGATGFGPGYKGQLEDWFTLLNLGFKITALGNSDSHDATGGEAGCPRNYVMSDSDDPAYLDEQALADAVKDHRVVATYGPFVRMWIDDQPIGSEVTGSSHQLRLEVQAPSWMDVDRAQVYENGTLIHEWEVEGTQTVRLDEVVDLEPALDSWYVAVVSGDGDMMPVFTPVEIPYLELQVVVSDALAGIPAVQNMLTELPDIPMEHPMMPFAVTNPVWVDLDGDGFDAPGLPEWWEAPAEE